MRKRSTTYSMFFVQNYTTYSYFVGQKNPLVPFFVYTRVCTLFLFLPIYSTQAGGGFGSVCFVVCDALTTLSVPRTAFFCTGTIYVIMWTRHIIKIYTSLLYIWLNLYKLLFYRACIKMRDAECKWEENLYKPR